jgi:hypothetical protein
VDPRVISVAVMPGAEAVGVVFVDFPVVVVVVEAVPHAAASTAIAASTATVPEALLLLNDIFNVSPLL